MGLDQFDFVTSVPIKYTLRSLEGRHFMTAKYKSLKVGSKEPASSPLSNGTKISPIGSLKIFLSPKNEVGGGQSADWPLHFRRSLPSDFKRRELEDEATPINEQP